MVLFKTLFVSLLVGTAFAASTLANLAPDQAGVMKSDLPVLTSAILPVGMDANPYPPNYAADIAFVADDEDCDEMEVSDVLAQADALEADATNAAHILRPTTD
jgi:hypothetical protein